MAAGLAFALLSLPLAAQTDSLSMSATHTTAVQSRIDNANGRDDDDNYGVIIDRLNANANAGDLATFVRVDAFGFLSPPSDLYRTQVRLERVGLSYQLGSLSLSAGDFYEQLGRGIVLSTRKLPEAGVDVAIFGARAAWVGEHVSGYAFAGRANAANMDSVNQRAVDDVKDILAGGNLELTPASGLRLGGYALYNKPEESLLPPREEDLAPWYLPLPQEGEDLVLSTGSYVDLPALVPWWSGYLEVAVQERYLAGQPQVGSAAYLTQELRLLGAAVQLEAMMLNAFEQKGSRNAALASRFDYNRPPTLERLDQEVINNRDVLGARLRAEYFLDVEGAQLLLYGNGMVRFVEFLEEFRLFQTHVYAGFDLTFGGGASRLAGAIGYRHEQQMNATEPLKTAILIDIDYLQALGSGVSVHATTQTQLRAFQGRPYTWGSTFLGVEKADLGSLTFELGYDTLDPSPRVRNIFYALITQWHVDERITLRTTAGTQRGGIKCVAGVCREWPAFSGVEGVLITRF